MIFGYLARFQGFNSLKRLCSSSMGAVPRQSGYGEEEEREEREEREEEEYKMHLKRIWSGLRAPCLAGALLRSSAGLEGWESYILNYIGGHWRTRRAF